LGTIIRKADWFGIKQVICSDQSVDCFNPKVVTATKGSLFRTKVIYTDLPAFVEQSKLPTVATSLSGSDLSGELDLTGYNVAFGSESHGISPALEAACSSSIRIPSFNSEAESLNLGVSVGVICGFIHLKGK
jgi:TrmH family RNA methyltransferase